MSWVKLPTLSTWPLEATQKREIGEVTWKPFSRSWEGCVLSSPSQPTSRVTICFFVLFLLNSTCFNLNRLALHGPPPKLLSEIMDAARVVLGAKEAYSFFDDSSNLVQDMLGNRDPEYLYIVSLIPLVTHVHMIPKSLSVCFVCVVLCCVVLCCVVLCCVVLCCVVVLWSRKFSSTTSIGTCQGMANLA